MTAGQTKSNDISARASLTSDDVNLAGCVNPVCGGWAFTTDTVSGLPTHLRSLVTTSKRTLRCGLEVCR